MFGRIFGTSLGVSVRGWKFRPKCRTEHCLPLSANVIAHGIRIVCSRGHVCAHERRTHANSPMNARTCPHHKHKQLWTRQRQTSKQNKTYDNNSTWDMRRDTTRQRQTSKQNTTYENNSTWDMRRDTKHESTHKLSTLAEHRANSIKTTGPRYKVRCAFVIGGYPHYTLYIYIS